MSMSKYRDVHVQNNTAGLIHIYYKKIIINIFYANYYQPSIAIYALEKNKPRLEF